MHTHKLSAENLEWGGVGELLVSVRRNTMSQTRLQGIPSTGSGIHRGR